MLSELFFVYPQKQSEDLIMWAKHWKQGVYKPTWYIHVILDWKEPTAVAQMYTWPFTSHTPDPNFYG